MCWNVHRTLIDEPRLFNWKKDWKASRALYSSWATEAWHEVGQRCAPCDSIEYEWGFLEGFSEYVFAGGTGQPPAVPPRALWNVGNREEDGYRAADDWFAGYRHGANVAREGGYRDLAVVRSSLATDALLVGGEPGVVPPEPLPPGEPTPAIKSSGPHSPLPAETIPAEPLPAESEPTDPMPANPFTADPVPADPVPADSTRAGQVPDELQLESPSVLESLLPSEENDSNGVEAIETPAVDPVENSTDSAEPDFLQEPPELFPDLRASITLPSRSQAGLAEGAFEARGGHSHAAVSRASHQTPPEIELPQAWREQTDGQDNRNAASRQSHVIGHANHEAVVAPTTGKRTAPQAQSASKQRPANPFRTDEWRARAN